MVSCHVKTAFSGWARQLSKGPRNQNCVYWLISDEDMYNCMLPLHIFFCGSRIFVLTLQIMFILIIVSAVQRYNPFEMSGKYVYLNLRDNIMNILNNLLVQRDYTTYLYRIQIRGRSILNKTVVTATVSAGKRESQRPARDN